MLPDSVFIEVDDLLSDEEEKDFPSFEERILERLNRLYRLLAKYLQGHAPHYIIFAYPMGDKGYRAITTPDIRSRVTSFVFNVREPLSAVNHTLQGNVKQALVSVGRLLINTTLGLGGLFDVAAGWGLERNTTGFDDTMAYYCIPDGPFFVAPFLGPITPRALVAYTADSFASPMYWGPLNDKNYADKISYSYAALVAINARERSLDLLDDLQNNSVDFYSTARSAYIQNRQKMNGRSLCGSDADPASYDFDFDMEDDDEE